MALRARLAVLYTSIVGGILLLFGVAVYASVNASLLSQVDSIVLRSLANILPNIFVNASGQLQVGPTVALDLQPGLFVQVWDRNHQLVLPDLLRINRPFDSRALQSSRQSRSDVNLVLTTGTVHLRVITIPLVVGNGERVVGALQVATSLAVVDATQKSLVYVLVFGSLISMLVAGLAGWLSTRQALAPLGDVTRLAMQITKADDLSRRITYGGPDNDEVGQLISSFNQTLARLENLFNTQRRFLADVGHELRTPLTVIKGNIDLMRRMNVIDIESMETIDNEVERLTRMVGDLLLLAQAESGKLPLNINIVELDTLLLEVMQQMNVLARNRVELKLGDMDQVLVCGDEDRLKQVMLNLIGNAISYTPQGGRVVVGLGKEGARARLTITDNGPGIPAEDLPHIFERFYRGEKARTRQKDGKGFGLGLSIAYWIVRNHKGQIDVDSRVGSGTTFCVWLPLAQGDCEEQQVLEPVISKA